MSDVGTVGTVNVASVVVSCTTNFYTVGGSVAGLAGAGLVVSTVIFAGSPSSIAIE